MSYSSRVWFATPEAHQLNFSMYIPNNSANQNKGFSFHFQIKVLMVSGAAMDHMVASDNPL